MKKLLSIILVLSMLLCVFVSCNNEEEDAKLREELKAEIKSEFATELKADVTNQLKSELTDSVKSQLRTELTSQVKVDLSTELSAVIETELREQIRSELRTELTPEVEAELIAELTPIIEAQLKAELNDKKGEPYRTVRVSSYQDSDFDAGDLSYTFVGDYNGFLAYVRGQNIIASDYEEIVTEETFNEYIILIVNVGGFPDDVYKDREYSSLEKSDKHEDVLTVDMNYIFTRDLALPSVKRYDSHDIVFIPLSDLQKQGIDLEKIHYVQKNIYYVDTPFSTYLYVNFNPEYMGSSIPK